MTARAKPLRWRNGTVHDEHVMIGVLATRVLVRDGKPLAWVGGDPGGVAWKARVSPNVTCRGRGLATIADAEQEAAAWVRLRS